MSGVSGFLDALRERVLIFDGAMGTQIQARDLDLDHDYDGQEGNVDILTLTRPDVVREIHAAYFAAGADCVETNTFGANTIVQDEYANDARRVHEMNVAAARIAREAAASFDDRPRFVAGSMGPGTKAPSLGQATYDELEDSYYVQAAGLLEGGVDALLVETAYDLLQVKSTLAAIMRAFDNAGRRVPVMTQVTIETTGTMLLGSEIGAALATLEPFRIVDVIGINCATGPVEMTEHVRYLCDNSRKFVSVLPNAGLPEMRDGKPYYGLTPAELLKHHKVFVEEFGANIVGGCCGTTPEHIEVLARELGGRAPKPREPQFEPACASLYIAQPFRQQTSFFVIGERCNAQGSRRFKSIVGEGDWDRTVEVAKEQVREGAHALDVSVDYTGRDGAADMTELISRFRTQATLPIFLDSTEPAVIEAGLKLIGGRPVINSVNLEDGREPGTRIDTNLRNAYKYGAAVVGIAIDERGQATTKEWKVEASRQIFEVALEYGLEPHDIIFDPIVLPISTGLEEARHAGVETLDAVQQLKKDFPESYVSLGISNVSFGLNPAARQVLNSVFLHEAVARGLDMAIVHAAQILPMNRIDDRQREVALDLVYDRRRDDYDPLQEFIRLFEGVEHQRGAGAEDLSALPLEERLTRRIIDGNRNGLEADLDEALQQYPALQIINDFLLQGMKTVGEYFASGEMQLPFVLQSAETMKSAVAHLEPHMEKVGDGSKGRIVLATVKGDVHDIGKNLVDIILTNNGYTVYNLGIKQPIASIIEAAEQHAADAIGLSGLLVKSTVVMREDLEELNRRDLHGYPVILGGAALTRSYVEDDLRRIYQGKVFYGRDAFEGLNTMDALMAEKRGDEVIEYAPREKKVKRATVVVESEPVTRSDVATDVPVPVPPFFGSRVVKGIPIADIVAYLNKTTLFRGQWEFKRKREWSAEQYQEYLAREAEPVLRDLLAQSIEDNVLQPAVVYGYFPAQSEGNDLIVYDDAGKTERVRFTFPRQARDRHLCIADFFRPVSSGEMDVVAFHLVTMGRRVSDVARELFARDEYQRYFFLHGLGVEMAEALAELWHKRIRTELGIVRDDAGDPKALFDQGYRGSRYSFGYPACPNLEDQRQLFELLEPERIDVRLSEEFQLDPEQSTSAIVVHHPEAKYFSVGRQS
jgi:5-methyltetrahydrofolate--homocysteine methyltransferase